MKKEGITINQNVKKTVWLIAILVFCLLIAISTWSTKNNYIEHVQTQKTAFKIIASTENQDLETVLQSYAKQNKIDLEIDYAGTIEIMDKLNSGEYYDAVWTSNSIWLYMLNSNVSIKNSKSTSINPVVFGITKSKAEELGFTQKDVYTEDILNAIREGKLKFNMSSATQTNTGATAYLGFLTTLAGNPEILREEDLEKEELKQDLKTLFSGMSRSSGTEEFLEEMFLNGNYDAVITYETSIINLNKQLVAKGKEPLYVIYTKDGVSISDSPFAYIDHKNGQKADEFAKLQSYLLSNERTEQTCKNRKTCMVWWY